MDTLETTYQRTVELTEQNIREGRYSDPLKQVQHIIDELEQLEDLHLLPHELSLQWRNKLYTLVCGS